MLALRRSDGTLVPPLPRMRPPLSDSDASDADDASTTYASIARHNATRLPPTIDRRNAVRLTFPAGDATSSSAIPPAPTASISAQAAHQSAALSLAISRSLNLEAEVAEETGMLRRQAGDLDALEHEASRRALNDAHRQLRAAERTIALLQSVRDILRAKLIGRSRSASRRRATRSTASPRPLPQRCSRVPRVPSRRTPGSSFWSPRSHGARSGAVGFS